MDKWQKTCLVLLAAERMRIGFWALVPQQAGYRVNIGKLRLQLFFGNILGCHETLLLSKWSAVRSKHVHAVVRAERNLVLRQILPDGTGQIFRTHLYAAQSVHPALLVNELLLLLTGTSCGILMNLYMPGNSAKIRRAQSELEQIFRNTFHRIARDIVMDKQLACTFFDLSDLDLILKKLEKEAHENQGNTLLSDEQYFVKYVEMRKNQKLVVEKLCQNIRLLHDVPIQAHAISHFIEDVSIKFHESNNTQELMQKLTEMQTSMQKEPLPVTRTEFENRAVLYRILYDLEELITIKKRFIETLTPDEIKRFWNTSQNCCQ